MVTLPPVDPEPCGLVRVVTRPPDGADPLPVEPELECDGLVRLVTGAPDELEGADPCALEPELECDGLVRVVTGALEGT